MSSFEGDLWLATVNFERINNIVCQLCRHTEMHCVLYIILSILRDATQNDNKAYKLYISSIKFVVRLFVCCTCRNLELKYANSVDKEHRVCLVLRAF